MSMNSAPVTTSPAVEALPGEDRHAAFRAELRAFFHAHVPADLRRRLRSGLRPTPAEWTAWQGTMFRQGWAAPTWPVQYGGTGWDAQQLYVFEQEAAQCDAPVQFHQGLELIGPILFTYGSPEQKARFLPRILSGEDWWCQGYSEPGAGSDLAALRTRAERQGDHYVVNGQKLWTSFAQDATMMFCLVRTETTARKQDGISLLLVDMATPGIRIRPIQTLDEQHHVNEVFLDDVRVPVGNLVGEEGKGWTYGKVLLQRERGMTATLGLRLARQLEWIAELAARTPMGARDLLQDPTFAHKLAQLRIEVIALDTMGQRTVADVMAGTESGLRGSMLKIRWSELLQRSTELWVETLGQGAHGFAALPGADAGAGDDAAQPDYPMPGPMTAYLHARVTSIYGGANEIQRNIIAQRALGL
jgi:alkylation response protein AidB-like acyl-CoA dehydrogenase